MIVFRYNVVAIGIAVCALLGACEASRDAAELVADPGGSAAVQDEKSDGGVPPNVSEKLDTFEPRIPAEHGPHGSTLLAFTNVEVAAQHDWTGEAESCGSCHAQQADEWRQSIHHYASFQNPWYRAVVERFRVGVGRDASLFCAGCHDPALVATGAMSGDVTAETEHVFAGVTCIMCHRATEARPDGNAALTIDLGDELEIARRDVPEHRERMNPATLSDSTACLSCHRGILSPDTGNHHSIVGMDDASEWQRSAWSGNGLARIDSVPAQDCVSCHMQSDEHGVASHRFLGAQTASANGASLTEQLSSLQSFLASDVADISIVSVRAEDGRLVRLRNVSALHEVGEVGDVSEDDLALIDVLIENVGAGHRLPGGTLDLQDTWVELTIRDESGVVIATIGDLNRPDSMNAAVFRLKAAPVDTDGAPLIIHETENFRTLSWNHTIQARDVVVARFRVPAEAREALASGRVQTRLLHRRHPKEFYAWVCEESRGAGAIAFDQAFEELGGAPVDACKPQPVTVLAVDTFALGEPATATGTSDASTARLMWRYAEGLGDALQEQLDEALRLIAHQRRALELSDDDEARLSLTEASIRGRLGQTDRALALIDQVAETFSTPALDYQRYLALARVWRWDEAGVAAATVTDQRPAAELGWIALSRSLASQGLDMEALEAAAVGLRIQPRSPEMLRTQYTSLRRLIASDDPRLAVVQAAYRSFRVDEEAREIQARCYQSRTCENERIPLRPRDMVLSVSPQEPR